jgi:hypothetical protein
LPPATLKACGTTTFSSVMPAFCTVRRAVMFWMFVEARPGGQL